MNKTRRQKLEKGGFEVGGTQEFLKLSDAEMVLIDVPVALSKALRERRSRQSKISQTTFAKRVGSSQSRVAKMEAGDPSVSIDLLIRCLITSGSTAEEVGRVISRANLQTAAT